MSTDLLSEIRTWTSDEYPGFVSCVNKLADFSSSTAKELIDLIRLLREQVHILPEHLVHQLFEPLSAPGSWITADTSLMKEVMHLLVSIAVHFNGLSHDVVDVFVTLLFMKHETRSTLEKENPAVHMFQMLMKIAPQSESLITEKILHKLPGWRKPPGELIWPIWNSLYLFCSPQTVSFLSTSSKVSFICKLCKILIDLELSLEDTDLDLVSDDNIPQVLQDQFESMRTSMADFLTERIAIASDNWMKLDQLTLLVLSHLRFLCAKIDSTDDKLDWPLLCAVFKKMRELFAQHILPVSSTVASFPLVCFSTTSLRGGMMVSLTEFLWKTVRDEHADLGSRIHALSFLTFLMARVSACFLDLVVELLHDMTGWCVDYVYRNRSRIATTKVSDLYQTNRMYYAVCDSLFYILVQLHASLFDSTYHRSSCDRLPLAQITCSPLDPWSRMSVPLRHAVSMLISDYHLGWGMLLVGAGHHPENALTTSQLEQLQPGSWCSLPFSTCRLPLSKPFLSRLLRPYCLGKSITTSTSMASQPNSSARKRRTAADLKSHGVNSSKLARIVNGN